MEKHWICLALNRTNNVLWGQKIHTSVKSLVSLCSPILSTGVIFSIADTSYPFYISVFLSLLYPFHILWGTCFCALSTTSSYWAIWVFLCICSKRLFDCFLSGNDVNVHVLTNLDAVDLHAEVTEQDLVSCMFLFLLFALVLHILVALFLKLALLIIRDGSHCYGLFCHILCHPSWKLMLCSMRFVYQNYSWVQIG